MRVWISGGSGFVGSHLVRAFDDVCAPTHAEVDVTDAIAVRRSIAAYRPDAIVHAAILNDFTRLDRDGWRGYVDATRNVVDAAGGTVARISAVQAASDAPRRQDAGFGYFVASLVRALRAGETFTVWEGEDINMLATPTLATDAAALIARVVGGGHTGVFHCCGGEGVDRRTLAERTTATAAALGVELPDLDTQLRELRTTMEVPA